MKSSITLLAALGICTTGALPARAQQPPPQQPLTRTYSGPAISPAMEAREQEINAETCSLDRAAATAYHGGDFKMAEAYARQSLAIGPGSGVSQELLAQALFAQGKDQEALQAYGAICGAGINAARNGLPYALLLLRAGQWEQALAVYQKTLPLVGTEQSDVMPHINLAFSQSDPQPALLAAAIHVALGITYDGGCDWTGKGQYGQALDQFRQALALEPSWGLANFYYGYGLQHMGLTVQARAAFGKTLTLSHGGAVQVAARKALAGMKKAA